MPFDANRSIDSKGCELGGSHGSLFHEGHEVTGPLAELLDLVNEALKVGGVLVYGDGFVLQVGEDDDVAAGFRTVELV